MELRACDVAEMYHANYDEAKVAVFGGRALAGDELKQALRKAERAAKARTKQQVRAATGSLDAWQRYRNEAAASVRRFKNRGDRNATPFTKQSRSVVRRFDPQQSDYASVEEWRQAKQQHPSALSALSEPERRLIVGDA